MSAIRTIGHVIWEESYESQGLHDWLFDQHRLMPDAIQFAHPADYPTLSGSITVDWTAPNPDDSLEVWFSPDQREDVAVGSISNSEFRRIHVRHQGVFRYTFGTPPE